MPQVLHNIILVAHIMLAVGLIAIIILMQRSEGGMGGLGGGGGGAGGMGGFLAGRTQANVVTRTTAILATGFFLTSLTLAISDHRGRDSGPLVPEAPVSSTPSTGGATTAPGTAPATGSDSGAATTPAAPATPAQPAAPSGQ